MNWWHTAKRRLLLWLFPSLPIGSRVVIAVEESDDPRLIGVALSATIRACDIAPTQPGRNAYLVELGASLSYSGESLQQNYIWWLVIRSASVPRWPRARWRRVHILEALSIPSATDDRLIATGRIRRE